MIISRTPYRVSFFGGGTDYPVWFREHGGAVLAAAINHYCYITCRFMPPFFEHASRIVWSKIELVDRPSEIEHPAIRAAAEMPKIEEGFELHHNGDLPARSGLGSSSAFSVGLLHALYALHDHEMSKGELAERAIHLEQNLLRENVGVQDQIQTAFGGVNRIEIKPDGTFDVQPVAISEERLSELENHLLLFYTGVSRNASDIAARLSDQISPNFVNDIYDRAVKAGAIGGKLLGAGGGGFMLFVVRPEDHLKVLTALNELLLVPMQFDWGGTQVIFKDAPRYSQTAHHRRDYTRYIVGENGEISDLDVRPVLRSRLR